MTRIFRALFFLVFGLLLGGTAAYSFAGSYTSYQGSAYRTINGTTYWKGDSGTFAQSQARVIESINVGGKHIGVPHLGSVGAAALQLAITGLKTTPGAFLTTGVISYLAGQGLQYLDGQWKKQGDSIPVNDTGGCFTGSFLPPGFCGTVDEAKQTAVSKIRVDNGCQSGQFASYCPNPSDYTCFAESSTSFACTQPSNSYTLSFSRVTFAPRCPTGYTESAGACFPDDYVPAGESDWDRVAGNPPPDAVMRELCQKIAALNTTSPGCPVINARTEPAEAPLSAWKTDSVTGQQSRTLAKLLPAPTTEDPFRQEITIETEKKIKTTTTDPETGQTTTTEETEKTEKQNEDFCVLHPNSIACAELGEPENVDTKADTRNVVIAPDSGWGAGSASCPQPKTHVLRTGHTVTMSWQPVCDGAGMFRPVVLGLAWLAAIYAFMAIHRKSQA